MCIKNNILFSMQVHPIGQSTRKQGNECSITPVELQFITAQDAS